MNTGNGKQRSPAEWKKFRAQKRADELCQIWIRFAEAMRADGIKLGQFEGIDKFESWLWDTAQKARRQVQHIGETIAEQEGAATAQ